MISFAPTEDEELAKNAMHVLAREVLRPAAGSTDCDESMSPLLIQALWDTGLTRMLLDESSQVTSAPRSRILSCIVLEELGWGDAAMAVCAAAPMAYAQAILDYGSETQQRELRAGFSNQSRFGVVLVHEPGFDFDVDALSTEVERRGDGFVLRGAKVCLPLSSICQDLLVVARYDGRVCAFLVPISAPGVSVLTKRGSLGLKGLEMCTVRFDAVSLSAKALLGDDRPANALLLIDSARVGLCSILTGIARAVFDHIVPYTKSRFAHGSALAQKQSVAFRLADMAIATSSMRWMCWSAASALEKGRVATRAARLAQIHCIQKAIWIADEGIQLMGGHGYMRDNPVERWYRDTQTLSLLEGLVGV